jgi:hypothetical protein
VHAGEPFRDALAILQDLGYDFARVDGRALRGTPAELERAVPDRALWNVVASPR